MKKKENKATPAKTTRYIELDGALLTPRDVQRLIEDDTLRVRIIPSATRKIKEGRALLLRAVEKRAIYGVNTGFGPMVMHIIGTRETTNLQYNLLRGHATGMGKPVKDEYVLAAMLIRLNMFVKGHSGVSYELVQTLADCVNARITPIVPEHGAVGTSGDLVQLAHIALMLIGEGEVCYKGVRRNAADVLRELGIIPHVLGPKEGLSLINGTAMMSGIGCLLLADARRCLSIALRSGALAFELVNGFTDVLHPSLHDLRPHRGQVAVARMLRELTHDSQLLSDRKTKSHTIHIGKETHDASILLQEVYSLRCMPQVLGPILETISHVEEVLRIEINAVTDNPVIDFENEEFLHGGNFHGDYIATALDQLKMGIIKLTLLTERRINFFLNQNVNKTFPPFLNLKTPGLNMGLQGMQFVATSTAAVSQSLGYPHSLHSIPTNGDNQDIVSMGTDVALIAAKTLENALIVLTIELVTLSQAAATIHVEQRLSTASQMLVRWIRPRFPLVEDDRILSPELESLRDMLAYEDTLDLTW